jgi:hypothetical protein
VEEGVIYLSRALFDEMWSKFQAELASMVPYSDGSLRNLIAYALSASAKYAFVNGDDTMDPDAVEFLWTGYGRTGKSCLSDEADRLNRAAKASITKRSREILKDVFERDDYWNSDFRDVARVFCISLKDDPRLSNYFMTYLVRNKLTARFVDLVGLAGTGHYDSFDEGMKGLAEENREHYNELYCRAMRDDSRSPVEIARAFNSFPSLGVLKESLIHLSFVDDGELAAFSDELRRFDPANLARFMKAVTSYDIMSGLESGVDRKMVSLSKELARRLKRQVLSILGPSFSKESVERAYALFPSEYTLIEALSRVISEDGKLSHSCIDGLVSANSKSDDDVLRRLGEILQDRGHELFWAAMYARHDILAQYTGMAVELAMEGGNASRYAKYIEDFAGSYIALGFPDDGFDAVNNLYGMMGRVPLNRRSRYWDEALRALENATARFFIFYGERDQDPEILNHTQDIVLANFTGEEMSEAASHLNYVLGQISLINNLKDASLMGDDKRCEISELYLDLAEFHEQNIASNEILVDMYLEKSLQFDGESKMALALLKKILDRRERKEGKSKGSMPFGRNPILMLPFGIFATLMTAAAIASGDTGDPGIAAHSEAAVGFVGGLSYLPWSMWLIAGVEILLGAAIIFPRAISSFRKIREKIENASLGVKSVSEKARNRHSQKDADLLKGKVIFFDMDECLITESKVHKH